jgi:hypothetical protein
VAGELCSHTDYIYTDYILTKTEDKSLTLFWDSPCNPFVFAFRFVNSTSSTYPIIPFAAQFLEIRILDTRGTIVFGIERSLKGNYLRKNATTSVRWPHV